MTASGRDNNPSTSLMICWGVLLMGDIRQIFGHTGFSVQTGITFRSYCPPSVAVKSVEGGGRQPEIEPDLLAIQISCFGVAAVKLHDQPYQVKPQPEVGFIRSL